MSKASGIHIGTSGWHYKHWKGPFYPQEISTGGMLSFYTERFHTVEINNSFYRLPKLETFEQWRKGSPDEFIFAVKASRYITHMKKLKEPAALSVLLEHSGGLHEKQGPTLFQLPPKWEYNAERFRSFTAALPEGLRFAFEFRNPSWFNDQVYEVMLKKNIAVCIYELAGFRSPSEVTADFVYVRLHGPGGPYQGEYDTKTLEGWADAFRSWARRGKEIFCYFDNDQYGFAARNAEQLQEMIARNGG